MKGVEGVEGDGVETVEGGVLIGDAVETGVAVGVSDEGV